MDAREFAGLIGIGLRQVENLVAEGCPVGKHGKKRAFGQPAVRWYIKRKEDAAAKRGQPAKYGDAKARQMEADAQLKEFELARLEGLTITVDEAESEIAAVLDRLRARLVNVPGKYAPKLVGKKTLGEAKVALEDMTAEVMDELSKSGEPDANETEGADDAAA